MPEYQKMPTRTTKRGGANSGPADVFEVQAETSMDEMAEPAAKDGRNPHIKTGDGAVTGTQPG
jgi:hypothetical protein